MYITLETDYAIRIVTALAQSGGRLGANKLSETGDIPQRFTIKILRKLSAAGIVVSFMGSQGGYELGKSPEELTLLDVLETVEGKYMLSRCLTDDHSCCPGKASCKAYGIFAEISEDVRKKLGAISIASLI